MRLIYCHANSMGTPPICCPVIQLSPSGSALDKWRLLKFKVRFGEGHSLTISVGQEKRGVQGWPVGEHWHLSG